MGQKDQRVDAYIEKAADFAKPILNRLRALVHKGCPGVQETIKWGVPAFEYKGPFFGCAAFKKHCVFGFWKSKLLEDPGGYMKSGTEEAMGGFGRVSSIEDLPPEKAFLDFVRQAKNLHDEGLKVPRKASAPKTPVEAPPYFMAALGKSKAALATFKAFSPTNKREYVEWILDAKTEATREKRLKQAVEWMAEGKVRNWKYVPSR